MERILLAGASGHARVIIDILERQQRYSLAGLLDHNLAIGQSLMGYPVLGQEGDLPQLIRDHDILGIIVAIGDNHRRAQVTAQIGAHCPDVPFVTAIHPSASVSPHSKIGAGSVIMAGAIVNPGCRIGQGCIINSGASLDHDSVLEDFASLAPGVVTGGNCRVGRESAISIGAILRHGITVGDHAVVGAGALVLKPIPDGVVAYGSPAAEVRRRAPGDRYL